MSRHKVVSARVLVIEGLNILKKQYPKVADGAFLEKKTPIYSRKSIVREQVELWRSRVDQWKDVDKWL